MVASEQRRSCQVGMWAEGEGGGGICTCASLAVRRAWQCKTILMCFLRVAVQLLLAFFVLFVCVMGVDPSVIPPTRYVAGGCGHCARPNPL